MAEAAAKILLDAEFASTVLPKLKRQASMMESQLKMDGKMFNSRGVREFSDELDRANQRVITLGIAFQSLRTVSNTLSNIAKSSIEVEKAFTDINSVFELTSDNLDKFGKGLFNVARETSQEFKNVAEAAKEFSRQGLSAEETLKRVKSALTLSRVASLDVVDSVNVLTASINGFSKAGLTAADITNKLLAVDTRFAVSASDLADALARSGSAASDAGVNFDQLLGIITAVQQTTARGGAVIGNSLKTIFTRIQRQDTLDALESLGVQVRNANEQVLSGVDLLEAFAKSYDRLGESSKRSVAEIVGGVYQINILKAAVADLSKEESIYARATQTSAEAKDEETKRNEALNKSLDATITRLGLAGKQIGANIGNLGFSQFARTTLNLLTENPITKSLEDASGKAETIGGKIAEGLIKGFGNAVLIGLGPVLLRAFSNITSLTFGKITTDLLQAAESTPLQSYTRGRQGRMPRRSAEGYIPNAAGSYIPFSEESSAISKGVGGAPLGAKPVLLNNFKYGGGVTGPILANSSEYIVPNFANGGSAIFNQNMIKQYGLPPGSTPVAAGGYIPNAAEGINPGYSGLTISQVNQYLAKRGVFNYGMPSGSVLPNPMDLAYRMHSGAVPPNFIGPVYPSALGGPLGPVTNPVTKIMGGASFPYTSTGNLPTVPAGSGQYALQFAQAKAELSPALNATQKRDLERAQERELRDRKDIASTNELIANQKKLDYEKAFEALEEERRLAKEKLKLTKEEIQLSDEVAKNTQYLYLQARKAGQKMDKEAGLSLGLKSRNLKFGKPEPFSATFVPGADPNAPTVREQVLTPQGLQAVRQAVANENARYAQTASLTRRGGPDMPETFFSRYFPTFNKMLGGTGGTTAAERREMAQRAFARRGAIENAGLAASFALPFAAGFVPEAPGGTTAGKTYGAIGGALIGAGAGAGIGSAIPGIGTLAGAGAGAVIGGLSGLISKMTESFDEMALRLDKISKGIKSESEATLRVLQLQDQITEAESKGLVADARNLREQLFSAQSNITSPELLKILSNRSVSPEERFQQASAAINRTLDLNQLNTRAQTIQGDIQRLSGPYARGLSISAAFDSETLTKSTIPQLTKDLIPLLRNFTDEQLTTLSKLNSQSYLTKYNEEENFRTLLSLDAVKSSAEGIAKYNKDFYETRFAATGPQAAFAAILQKSGFQSEKPVSEIGTSVILLPVLREAIAKEFSRRAIIGNPQQQSEIPAGFLTPTLARQEVLSTRLNAFRQSIQQNEADKLASVLEDLILRERPGGYTELQAAEISGAFSQNRALRQFEIERQRTFGLGKSTLLENIPQVLDPNIRNRVSGLQDLKGLIGLQQELGTLEGAAKLSGLGGKTFKTELDKLIEELQTLQTTQDAQVEAIRSQTGAIIEAINFRQSRPGVLQAAEGELARAQEDLTKQQEAGAPLPVIQGTRQRISGLQVNLAYAKFGPEQGVLESYRQALENAQRELQDAIKSGNIIPEVIDGLTQNINIARSNLTTIQFGAKAGELGKLKDAITTARGKLADLKETGAAPDIITNLQNEIEDLDILLEYKQFQDEKLYFARNIASNARRDQVARERQAIGIEEILRNPTLPGAQYVTGAQITGGLMEGAKSAGLQGKSAESFFGGFRSVIAGAKRDLQDFSDIGANIANSLQSNLGNAFGDFVTGAKSAKDAFKDFTISVLNDASRALASKAVQGLLVAGFQAIGLPMGSTGGQFTGGAFKFAKGGKVPALLTGGEYVIPPDAARSIGYDTLRKINRYADGGLVNGGSGVKDDVPARLAPGSFVIKKATVDRLGPDYFHSLSNGRVQKRFVGGAIVGALIGGGIGYATGGKKGAIGGAILGGIAGGVYSYNSSYIQANQAYSGGYELVGDSVAPTMSTGTKLGLLGGASVGLGLLSAGIAAPKKESQAISLSEVPRYAAQLEAEQEKTFATNRFAYLGRNSGGGYSIGSFGPAPATRRFAGGGMVGGETQMAMDFMPRFANGGEVGGGAPLSIQSPTSSGGSGNAPNVNVKIEINNNGQMSSSKSTTGGNGDGTFNEDFANKLETAIRPVVQDEILRQMRNDGIFSQRSRFVNNF
jgi:TP901 family phage tail tape measure protein